MRHPTSIQIADVPEGPGYIDAAAWDRAFRAWERRRALPSELDAIERREATTKRRAARTKQQVRDAG